MKNIFIFLIGMFILTSCSSHLLSYTANENIKNISLGMTRDEVVAIMGNHYKLVKAQRTEKGLLEVISYESSVDRLYELSFINSELDSWESVWKLNNIPYNQVTNKNDHPQSATNN